MKLHEEFKLWENMWEEPVKEDIDTADYHELIEALDDMLDCATLDKGGQHYNVLITAAPEVAVLSECKKWAAANKINLVYVDTATVNASKLSIDNFTTANTVVFLDNLDKADSATRGAAYAVLCEPFNNKDSNIQFSIARITDNNIDTRLLNTFVCEVNL